MQKSVKIRQARKVKVFKGSSSAFFGKHLMSSAYSKKQYNTVYLLIEGNFSNWGILPSGPLKLGWNYNFKEKNWETWKLEISGTSIDMKKWENRKSIYTKLTI